MRLSHNKRVCISSLSQDLCVHIVAFLRPHDVNKLGQASKIFYSKKLCDFIAYIDGKLRFPDRLVNKLHLLKRLEVLNLKGNKLSNEGSWALSKFLALPSSASSLQRLDLSGLFLTPSGITLLAKSLATTTDESYRSTNGGHRRDKRHKCSGSPLQAEFSQSFLSIDTSASYSENCVGITPGMTTSLSSAYFSKNLEPQKPLLLRELTLAMNTIGDSGSDALCNLLESGDCQLLQSLDLRNTGIGLRGVLHLARGLARCPLLTMLSLSNNPLDVLYDNQVQSCSPDSVLHGTEEVGTGTNSVLSAPIDFSRKAWSALGRALPLSLRHLNLFNTTLNSMVMHRLVLNWQIPSLVHLNVSHNSIGSEGARLLFRSLVNMSCARIEHLNISHNNIRQDALIAISKFASTKSVNQKLRHLDLSYNPFGVEVLASASYAQSAHAEEHHPLCAFSMALASCPSLEHLDLRKVDLDENFASFAEGLKKALILDSAGSCTWRHLDISWNRIGENGARSIAGLFQPSFEKRDEQQVIFSRLNLLNLLRTGIGRQGAKMLADVWNWWDADEERQKKRDASPRLLVAIDIENAPDASGALYVEASRLWHILQRH